MKHVYVSPKFYRETQAAQNLRLEDEWQHARMQHAIRMAKQGLRYLETRRMCGEVFTSLEAQVMMQTQCKMDGVAVEYIPAAVSLIVDAYVPKAA